MAVSKQLGCFLKSLSSTPALAAAVAPPDRKLCKQNLDFSKPILLKADNSISLAVV
jgi:hypothetical protein